MLNLYLLKNTILTKDIAKYVLAIILFSPMVCQIKGQVYDPKEIIK